MSKTKAYQMNYTGYLFIEVKEWVEPGTLFLDELITNRFEFKVFLSRMVTMAREPNLPYNFQ